MDYQCQSRQEPQVNCKSNDSGFHISVIICLGTLGLGFTGLACREWQFTCQAPLSGLGAHGSYRVWGLRVIQGSLWCLTVSSCGEKVWGLPGFAAVSSPCAWRSFSLGFRVKANCPIRNRTPPQRKQTTCACIPN